MIDADDDWIAGLPIIDAHCHILNARDIPAARFITKVFLPFYSRFRSEAGQRRMEREVSDFLGKTLSRTPGYSLEKALIEARLAGDQDVDAGEALELPAFARGTAKACYGRDIAHNITAFHNLVRILTSYRHRNFEALMSTYETNLPKVGVALFTPAMVDMDFWLGPDPENPAPVSDIGEGAAVIGKVGVAQQIELMELNQRLYPGRCHGIVSFCPWRQVDDLMNGRSPTALDLVKDAVLNRGFVGVKLYPPMGFRPLGNVDLPREAFPTWISGTGYGDRFGPLIDEALISLYRFCVKHDVPVMAHCSPSNAAGFWVQSRRKRRSYAERAHPDGWKRVLASPGLETLRLNLAHFGYAVQQPVTQAWRKVIGTLMDRYPNVYADLSHYPELVLDNYTGSGQHCREAAEVLEPLRRNFLKRPAGDERVRRLLYGSDWAMLSKEFYYADYLGVTAHMYRRKIYGMGGGARRNARAFLSGNAIRFYGLRRGDKARERLEAWYTRHGLDAGSLARFDQVET